MYCPMGILVLFGLGLGIALNQIRILQKRLHDVEVLLLQVVDHLEEKEKQ